MQNIPLVDLKAQYQRIKPEIDRAIAEVIENTAFIQGKYVCDFEAAFAKALDIAPNRAIGCANGTAAISLCLEAAGIGPGDEVITVSHTFFATIEAILHTGAMPVLFDIRPEDYTMLPDAVEAAITAKTRSIVPVHIYGALCDMSALNELARKHDIFVLEDSAQAHLAAWEDRPAGTIGDAGTFSFYPGKNLGAYGDGGFIAMKDPKLAARVRKLADHGRQSKYAHDAVGYNNRLDGLQAAILSAKLKHLPDWSQARRRIARTYDERLKSEGFKVIEPDPRCTPVYHLYVVEVSNRDDVQEALKAKSIATGIHYPIPVHRQPAMEHVEMRTLDLPITERIVDRIVSLPIYPELSEPQQNAICDAFLNVARP